VANHVTGKCGHHVIAVGAPGSIARRRCEQSRCTRCTEFRDAVREWFRDIRSMDYLEARVSVLVYAWNWFTNPRALRLDRESRVCRAAARWIMAQLLTVPGTWMESDSGRLVPTKVSGRTAL